MREMLTVNVKGRYVVVPKLIGAFFIIVSALMLVYASLDAVTAWDRIKDLRSCVSGIYSADNVVQAYSTCVLKGISAGVYVYTPNMKNPGISAVPDEEFWAVMTPKLAAWLFWVVILIVSILVYQWGKLVIPVEERVTEVADVPAPAPSGNERADKEEKQAKKRTTRRRRATKSTSKKE